MKFSYRKILLFIVYLIIAILGSLTPYFWLSSLLIIVATILYFFNRATKKAMAQAIGGPNANERNFDYLLLGSTTVWKYIDGNNFNVKRLISFALYNRPLFSDLLNLKHKFSYLKEQGRVLITIDCQDLKTCCSRNLQLPDVQSLHRITLRDLKIHPFLSKYAPFYPVLFYPIYSFKLLAHKISQGSFKRREEKEYNEKESNYLISILSEMVEFCLQRDLIPEVIFINYDKRRDNISAIITDLKLKYKSLDSYLLGSVDQIADII